MKTRTLDDLVLYIYRRYPYPKSYWSKIHYEKRCAEIYASEQVIIKCMDSPLREPKEIIFDYMMDIQACIKETNKPSTLRKLHDILSALDTLYNYF